MSTKLMYRVSEAVEITGIPRSTLYELMASGQIESVKVGSRRYITGQALEDFVARLRREAEGELAADAAAV